MGHDSRCAQLAGRRAERTFCLNWWFASGHAVDLILAVLVLELLWLWRRSKWPFSRALLRLAPGAMMLFALRSALIGAAWPWIAAPLILSFPLHLLDLRQR